MLAADTIEVRLPRRSDGLPLPRRILLRAAMTVVVLIGLALSLVTGSDFVQLSGTRRLQLVRRSTGEVLVEGRSPAFRSRPLTMVIRRDADRLDEAALLAKWGEPREWHRLLERERY